MCRAHEQIKRIGAETPAEQVETLLTSVRLHSEIMEAWEEHGGGEPEEAENAS